MTTEYYLTISDLKNRGWNRRLIDRFLRKGDKFESDVARVGRPKLLFLATRVIGVELHNVAFKLERQKSVAMSRRAKSVIADKADSLDAAVNAISIFVPDICFDALRNSSMTCGKLVCESENRVALRTLLDTMNSLGDQLNVYTWHPGIRVARIKLKQRILERILQKYPQLADEAKRIKV